MVRKVTIGDELEKNKDLKLEDLNTLRDWYSKQPHLPPVTDEVLALFLHSCYYRIELSKITLDNYFTVRTHVPEFFSDRDPFKVNCRKGGPISHYYILPRTTPEGYRVIIAKLVNLDPADYCFAETTKAFFMFVDLDAHVHGTWPGFIIVFDLEGVVFGHLAKLHIMLMKKVLYYLQEAMPIRLQGLHFINIVPFMDMILALMKPFMKKELFDKMHLHTSDSKTFFNYVPQNILPREYGGEEINMAEMFDQSLRQLKDNKKWFEEEAKLRVQESKRAGKAKNAGEIFGVEGSFKKLDID